MKNVWITLLMVIILLALGYSIYRVESKSVVIHKDEMIVKKSLMDSINALANKPPVIQIDTVTIEKTREVIHHDFQYAHGDSILANGSYFSITPTVVIDSLVNPEINVTTIDKVVGKILNRNWVYVPKRINIKEIRFEYVPKIVNNPINVYVKKNGMYAYGALGGSKNHFMMGVGLDFISKKDVTYGYMYQNFAGESIHSIKVGMKLK
jgi:hypothetical protein